MPVILVHEGVTKDQYEAVCRRLTNGAKSRMELASDWPVEGLLVHAAGETPTGFRVVDIWESEDAVRAFGEHLEPILREEGVDSPPQVYPAHAYVSP